MSQDFATHTTRNTPQIQAQIKAGNLTLMRCAIPAGSTDAYIDLTANACTAMGCAMLAILIHNDLTWNQHLVSYLGSRCLLYEFANEPDLYAPPDNTPQAYLGWWNSQIPVLRRLNPSAAFIGPVMGIYANFIGSWGQTWLAGVKASGVLPDAVSYHVYPCTGVSSSSTCAPKATNFASCFTRADALVKSVLGFSLPQCLTEWNMDAAAPPASYTQDPAFCGTWTTAALNNIAQAGYAIACQWDAGGGAAGGLDDLVSTSTFQPQVQYQPLVNVINSYITGSGSGSGGGGTGGSNNSRLVGPDTPLGITIGRKQAVGLKSGTTAMLQDLGTNWLRFQPHWQNVLELTKGVYTFSSVDAVVAECNAQHVNLLLTVKRPPTWWQIPATSLGGSSYIVPSPQGSLLLAQYMAQRYDGAHGFGLIQGIELGNEDYDGGAAGGTSYVPLANTMNACYGPLKHAYPTLVVGPGATLNSDRTHIQYFWAGMWQAAGGNFDYMNHHYYCDDPSSDTVANGLSFQHSITLLQGCASAAGHANFPLWYTEIGWAINTNYGRGGIFSQQQQSDFLHYCYDLLQAANQPAKMFVYTLDYNTLAPTAGVGTSDGMSLFQGVPGQAGAFETIAYGMTKAYPEAWGGGTHPAATSRTRDAACRARLSNGSGTAMRDVMCRAGLKTAQNLRVGDVTCRAGLAGTSLADTFARANQPQWGNASDGVDTWVQAGGSATASIVSNRGQVTGATGTNTFRLGTATLADVEGLVHVSVSASGDIVGLTLRDSGLTSFARARVAAAQLQLVQQTPAAGFVVLASTAFAPVAGAGYWLRVRALGANVYAKIWQDAPYGLGAYGAGVYGGVVSGEPPAWQVSGLTTVAGAGFVGLACALGHAGDSAFFDSFSATEATASGLLPNTRVKDVACRAGLAARQAGQAQTRDVACRARLADTSREAITVTTYAAKRPPLLRRFPKS